MKTIITTIATILLTVFTFAQKVNPMIVSVTLTQPTCYGYSNGSISLTPNGGMGPYTYLWENGQTTSSLSNIPAGPYSVIINDAMGNTVGGIIVVPQPAQITISGNVTNAPWGTSNGAIDITNVNNAVGNFSWNWSSNNGQTMNQSSLDQTGLKAGGYKLTVIDANGCQSVNTFNVNSVINPNFQIKPLINSSTAISTYPNPSNGNFTIESKEVVNEVRVVNSTTGVEVLKSANFENKLEVNDLPKGIYMIYVTTENGTQIERVSVL